MKPSTCAEISPSRSRQQSTTQIHTLMLHIPADAARDVHGLLLADLATLAAAVHAPKHVAKMCVLLFCPLRPSSVVIFRSSRQWRRVLQQRSLTR